LDLESVDQAAGRNCIANLQNRVENFSRDRAVVFRGKVSSSCNIDILASTLSVGITESIGIESQFRVGQNVPIELSETEKLEILHRLDREQVHRDGESQISAALSNQMNGKSSYR
jgi:hypothetical protein